ncbi:hypothetical protein B0H16DRAFT_1804463 [Mycena metata]|uniref:F-box domain-containing protein n=1 Tax=Mycena metata TaxID=1033252 RepID=A0AAD7JIF6_9AGAR|nr:hypothetical protein B0H16DRAFT_1804463 [Mycena metata]
MSIIPPDIWGEIAACSPRQSVARLSAVSRAFYSFFSKLLYHDISPLGYEESELLMRTLSDVHLARIEHPVRLLRRLAIPYWVQNHPADNLHYWHEVVQGLGQSISPVGPAVGAALRVLHWDAPRDVDKLGGLLLTPRYFPHLEELSIFDGDATDEEARFDFLRVPGLKKLEFTATFRGDGYGLPNTKRHASWRVLRKGLEILPSCSPFLQSLSMKFEIEEPANSSFTMDPDLTVGLTQLRLPALTSLDFSFYAEEYFQLPNPAMNFAPLDIGSPHLTTLSLDIEGICVPEDANPTYLSHLTSFSGPVRNCAAIVAHTSNLCKLSLWIPEDDMQNTLEPDPFRPVLFPPNFGLSITSLDVRSVDTSGDTKRYPVIDNLRILLYVLIAAFPNLTHLRSHYRGVFIALTRLQHLAVRLWKGVGPDRTMLATTALPPAKYSAEINNELRPHLKDLAYVQVRVWGDCSLDSTGCESCDEAQERYDRVPDLLAEYKFAARNPGENFVVVRQRELGDQVREWEWE